MKKYLIAIFFCSTTLGFAAENAIELSVNEQANTFSIKETFQRGSPAAMFEAIDRKSGAVDKGKIDALLQASEGRVGITNGSQNPLTYIICSGNVGSGVTVCGCAFGSTQGWFIQHSNGSTSQSSGWASCVAMSADSFF